MHRIVIEVALPLESPESYEVELARTAAYGAAQVVQDVKAINPEAVATVTLWKETRA